MTYKANRKEDGLYTGWHENGQIASEGNFKVGKGDEGWTFYTPYANEGRDGKWTYYNEDGTIESVQNWKDGKLID